MDDMNTCGIVGDRDKIVRYKGKDASEFQGKDAVCGSVLLGKAIVIANVAVPDAQNLWADHKLGNDVLRLFGVLRAIQQELPAVGTFHGHIHCNGCDKISPPQSVTQKDAANLRLVPGRFQSLQHSMLGVLAQDDRSSHSPLPLPAADRKPCRAGRHESLVADEIGMAAILAGSIGSHISAGFNGTGIFPTAARAMEVFAGELQRGNGRKVDDLFLHGT